MTHSVSLLFLLFVTLDSRWVHVVSRSANTVPLTPGKDSNKD